jgi:hypothetical protein
MNEPQFVRSTAPHIVEVAEGSRNAKSKSATIGTDAQRVDSGSTAFVDAAPSAERRTLYLDEQSTDVLAPEQVITNANSASANISGMDVPLVNSNSTAFIHADPLAELKTVFFDEQSAMAARYALELDPAEAHALLLSSTSGPLVIEASAALSEPDKTPNPSQAHFKSQFSDQIGELKAKNDHVRAELKRRETAPSNKT